MQRNGAYIASATLGVVVSFAYFIPATLELGFIGGWASAFTAPALGIGLTWDLIFTDLIVFAMAIADRERLGRNYVTGTIAMGLTLGVCAALAVYAVGMRRPSETTGALTPPSVPTSLRHELAKKLLSKRARSEVRRNGSQREWSWYDGGRGQGEASAVWREVQASHLEGGRRLHEAGELGALLRREGLYSSHLTACGSSESRGSSRV